MDYCIHCGRDCIHPEYECDGCKAIDKKVQENLANPALVPIMCKIPNSGGASALKWFKRENME